MSYYYPTPGLVNHNFILAATGVFGTVASGTIGIKSAWDGVDHSRKFVYSVPSEFLDTFRTRIPQITGSQNPFGLKAGDCFKRFFPGATHDKPASFDANVTFPRNPLPILTNPPDFSSNPLACRIMKMSESRYVADNTYFAYKSETVIKAGNRGMALSVAVSNLKEVGKISYEFWLLQLNRTSYYWTVDQANSHGWNGSYSKSYLYNKFTTQIYSADVNQKWEVSELATSLPGRYHPNWRYDYKTSISIWQPFDGKGEWDTGELFGGDIFEGKVLRDYYGIKDGSKFLIAIKLPSLGIWSHFVDFCSRIKDQSLITSPYNYGNEYVCYAF